MRELISIISLSSQTRFGIEGVSLFPANPHLYSPTNQQLRIIHPEVTDLACHNYAE